MSGSLVDYVLEHTERGECGCGQCIDVGSKKDPTGHTADLCFFVVAKRGEPSLEEFASLTKEHKGVFSTVDPFVDGKEHNYIELGGWLGDQGIALQYMGLGSLLGAFSLLTPKTVLHIEDNESAIRMAERGLLSVQSTQRGFSKGRTEI